MREVVARTRRPGPWVWVWVWVWVWAVVAGQAFLLASWLPRLGGPERGLALAFVCASGLVIAIGVALAVVDLRATLLLTDDALLVERRWRPLRIPRAAVRAVDGNIHGRPSWSESVVLTVAGRDRPMRLGGFDVHARVLIPRLQDSAGVGATPDDPAGPRR